MGSRRQESKPTAARGSVIRRMLEMRLTEYEKCSGIELSTADRDALTEVAPSITIASTPGSEGVYDLTAGSTVGVVQTDTLSVEIRPKLPIDRVLFLISYSL